MVEEKNVFLLEILFEEMPLRFIKVLRSFDWFGWLDELGVEAEDKKLEISLRRFWLSWRSQRLTPRRKEIVSGPPKNVALKDGVWQKAAEKFAEKVGRDLESAIWIEKNGREYLAFEIETGGEDVADLVGNKVFEVLKKLEFPKGMRWTADFSFPRPVRAVNVWSDDGVKFYLYDLREYPVTWFDFVELPKNLEELKERFGDRVDVKKRAEALTEFSSEEHFEEVLYSVEDPVIVKGNIASKFEVLPDEVKKVVLKDTQKFFYCGGGEFAGVAEAPIDSAIVRKGYEKVVEARLEDALFYYNWDKRYDIDYWQKKLDDRIFHKRVGSVSNLVTASLKMLELLAEYLDVEDWLYEGLKYSKFDLETRLVSEFPELENFVGYLYLKERGYDEKMARVVLYHDVPKTRADELPPMEYVPAAVAYKMTLIKIAAENDLLPKGGKDPFGFRRAALTLGILLGALNLPVAFLREQLGEKGFEFFKERLLGLFKEKFDTDIAMAVLESKYGYKFSIEFGELLQRARDEERIDKLVYPYKRIKRILDSKAASETVEKVKSGENLVELLSSYSYSELEGKMLKLIDSDFIRPDIFENSNLVLDRLERLGELVAQFFDKFMVLSQNEIERMARVDLLIKVKEFYEEFAAFYHIKE